MGPYPRRVAMEFCSKRAAVERASMLMELDRSKEKEGAAVGQLLGFRRVMISAGARVSIF